jgi:membrane associated rhomboid family serine protease
MGIYDRQYMYQSQTEKSSGKSVIWYLIAINALIYLFIAPPGSRIFAQLACWGWKASDNFHIYQLLTSGFLHGGFSHILFNMYGLYLFGSIAAPILGEKRFLTCYLAGIIAGSLAFCVLDNAYYLVGASGGVCAVTVAAAMLEPSRKFFIIFMPFTPIKITTMVICYTVIDVLMALDRSSNVSNLAHLAGFVAGYAAMKLIASKDILWDPFKSNKQREEKKTFHTSEPKQEKSASSADNDGPVSNAELDALLDKVSHHGINSLSEYEIARLRRAREEMRGK